MSRAPETPKVVTANDLRGGEVVYLTADDRWSANLGEAEIIADEALAQMRLIAAVRRQNEVVGAYLAEVLAGPQGAEPAHYREAFRARGPSNYRHGKQERHV